MRSIATVALTLVMTISSVSAQQKSDRELRKLMVGAWRSPRHDYVYLADGTWWMGRPDPKGPKPKVTHGHWKIKDHQLCETVYVQDEGLRDNGCELITKLNHSEIVYGGYRMERISIKEVEKY
jgi:hypothetical protein